MTIEWREEKLYILKKVQNIKKAKLRHMIYILFRDSFEAIAVRTTGERKQQV